ncbi:TonB-dependent receptor domain-containing protein [Gramella sp. KN1008]|uniref:TonB-dependent receptor domain-containing protein n=1 Tax=Gramella sp. KN1008 TaxID=2529298 RepID=UPI00103A5410|nr:TonB-dependent receptor [Gramella sp. KN1008]TBW27892.1 TonB-dependent receptor [Gramella sp. KN1008]
MTRPQKQLGLLSIILFINLHLTGQVTGKITDSSEGYPLEYATAALFNQTDSTLVSGVITDLNGNFEIGNLEQGEYYLEASFLGYQTTSIKNILITKKNGKNALGEIKLIPGNQLNEVIVESERPDVINRIDRQVYNATSFKSAQGGTAAQILRNLPSVNIDSQGDISVRGSKGFVVLLNGNPIQGQAATLIAQLPANAIDRVEIITAPSAKYDPEGKGGIINILTKKGASDGAFAQLNIKGGLPSVESYDNASNTQRYGIDGMYNIRKGDWNISLGASYLRNDIAGRREGDVYTIINDTLTQFPSDGERSFDEVNYSGRFSIDYTPDTTNTYSLGFFAGKRSKDRTADIIYYDNHSVYPAPQGERIYTFQYYNENLRIRKGDFILGSFDYSHKFPNDSRINTSILYEYTLLGGPTTNQNLGYPNTDIVYQEEYNTNDNPLNGLRIQADYQWKPFAIGQLETGYQYRKFIHEGDFVYERKNNTTNEFELVPEFSSQVDLERTIHSGYAQLNGSSENWDYAAGARLEYMDRIFDLKDKKNTVDTTYLYDFVKVYPSASIQYSVSNSFRIKAAYSKRVERTTTFKMNPFPEREHSETLEQGDPTLKPEFIDLFEVGLTKNLKRGNSVFATAYFRNVKNVVNRVNTIYNDTILNRIYSNVGNSKSLGLEVGASLKPTENWSNFIGGNIYNYKIVGLFDDEPVNTNATIYSINVNSTYDFWKNSSVQFTFNYLSARNTAQGEDSRFYSPNLSLQKKFLDDKLTLNLQWQNMDMGLLDTNEQRITTYRPGEFYTTTNYVYEVDVVMLNLSYTFSKAKNRSKFIKSEFGEKEF